MESFYFKYKAKLLREMNEQPKLAIVPGSFKPPHKGHYAMVKAYSEMVGPDGKVLVVISAPSAKNQRKTPDGKVITPEVAEQIMKIYCAKLPNVDATIAPGGPVKFCYDIGDKLESGILIFGCSKKDDDIKRFKSIKKYIEDRNPNLIVIDPQTTAVDVTAASEGVVSASDFRRAFGDPKLMAQYLPDHLTDGEKEEVIKLLLN